MKFDRTKFFDGYRAQFGPLKQSQVDGLSFLLDRIEESDLILPQTAYVLASIMHETALTYQPIAEYGKGKGKAYGKPDSATGQVYYGRGFVQITWKRNYQTFTDLLGIDLVREADKALDPAVSWQIALTGMQQGLFTGKALSDYISADTISYRNARRVINGLDRADLIASYSEKFETILKDALC